jgi:hypothetical protein
MKVTQRHIRVLLTAVRIILSFGLVCCCLAAMYRVHISINLNPPWTSDQLHHAVETESREQIQQHLIDDWKAWANALDELFDFAKIPIYFCLLFLALQILEYLAFRRKKLTPSKE